MTSGSVSPQLQQRLDELKAKNKQTSASTTTTTKTTTTTTAAKKVKNYDIENNTFAKIVFDEDLTPDEKKEQIAKALVFDVNQTKEDNQKRLKEFELFKEYLQSERQRMAQDIIALTDTDAFAEMHEMFNEMNGAILEFDQSMKPLTDILDAVYKLRMEGKEFTLDVFKEIQEDKDAQVKRDQDVADRQAALAKLQGEVQGDKAKVLELGQQKKFFGLGKVKPEAQVQIDEINLALQDKAASLTTQQTELKTLQATPVTETKFAAFVEEKEQLRQLLDISSDEHRERQKRLIAAAQNFVNTTSSRGEEVLEHFSEMGEHIETLNEANRGMQGIYAIITEASTEAAKLNKSERDQLQIAPENESTVDEMQRVNKKADVEEHISTSDAAAIDTMKCYADLTKQASRIITMKSANREQVSKARELTSSGVAGVAEGLSTVLTVVSAAALNESAELARNSVSIMEDRTDLQSQQEALRQASGIADQADVLNKAVDSLRAYTETSKVVTETTKENLEVVKKAGEGVQGLIDELAKSVDEQRGTGADVGMQLGDGSTTSKFNKKAAANDDTAEAPAEEKKPEVSKIAQLGKKGLGK